MVLVGALGLVIGLATYGYNIVRAMGVRLVGEGAGWRYRHRADEVWMNT